MAGWTITGTDWADVDWADISIMNQFVAAVNERRWAYFGRDRSYALLAGGEDVTFNGVQSGALWPSLQTMQYAVSPSGVQALAIQSHDIDGTPRTLDYYDSTTKPILHWVTEAICKAAGLWVNGSEYGFRRAITMPDDWTDINDPAYIWQTTQNNPNIMRAGDIIGPWIFQDLQSLLNLMIWFQFRSFWTTNGQNTERWGTGDSEASAEADYAGDPNFAAIKNDPIINTGWVGNVYVATRRHPFCEKNVFCDPAISKDIAWYGKIQEVASTSFQGDTVPAIGEWYNWLTDNNVSGSASAISSERYKAARWSVSPNIWGAEGFVHGYGVFSPKILVNYARAGGFTYY